MNYKCPKCGSNLEVYRIESNPVEVFELDETGKVIRSVDLSHTNHFVGRSESFEIFCSKDECDYFDTGHNSLVEVGNIIRTYKSIFARIGQCR